VHVDLVTDNGGGYDVIFAVLLFQCFELVEDLLGGNGLLVDPALLALRGLDLEETASVVEYLEFVAVFDGSGAVGDCRYAIAQERLLRGDVDVLCRRLRAQLRTAAKRYRQREAKDTCQPRKRSPWIDLGERGKNNFETPPKRTLNP
jgi:hypothetical protein